MERKPVAGDEQRSFTRRYNLTDVVDGTLNQRQRGCVFFAGIHQAQ